MRYVRPIQKTSGRPLRGAKSPGIGYIYILLTMMIAIAAATLLSGGFVPVDPTGPGGPPTIEPYYDPDDYGKQNIIMPTGPDSGAQKNLQLKTFTVNTCASKTAFDFLIDTSGSMKFSGKMNNTQTALREFMKNLAGKSVVGIQTFSKDVKEQVPLNYYKINKEEVNTAINGLEPDGYTRTRDGFQIAKQKLIEAMNSRKFPGYKYSLIVMTDGVPEIPPDQPRTCIKEADDPNTAPAKRCFAKEQDPRIPTNLADDIKNIGVTIYTINIYSPDYPSDTVMLPYLEALLKEVATQPSSTHYYSSINAGNLQKVFEDMTTIICDPQNQL